MSNFVVQSNVHLNEIKGKINTLANDISNSHTIATHKTFTLNHNPTETISTTLSKDFIIQGGVDASSNSLSQLNPIKVDDVGLQYVSNDNITKGQDSKAIGVGLVGTTGSQMRTLKTDDIGQLKISNSKNEFLEVQGTSHAIGANSASSIEINADGYSKVSITLHSENTNELLIEGSNTSGGTFMVVASVYPSATTIDSSGTTINLASIVLDNPPSYLRLRNKTATSITLNSYHFKSVVN